MEKNTFNIETIMQHKKGICFSGGGVFGYGHGGVLDELFEMNAIKNITHTVGSSVGSIYATAVSCNVTRYYINNSISEMDISLFKDGGCWLSKLFRLIKHGGFHKGYNIWNFAKKLVNDLTGNKNITMKEAYDMFGITLTITVFSLRYRTTRYINHITQPQAKLADMIRASSGIAIFFKIFKTKLLSPPDKNGHRILETDMIGDGGTTDNQPTHVLREQGLSGREIITVKFLGTKDIDEYNLELNGGLYDHGLPRIPIGMIESYIDGMRDDAMNKHVHKNDWKITIKINTGDIKVTDFNISETNKKWLYENGKKAVKEYLIEGQQLLNKGKYPN